MTSPPQTTHLDRPDPNFTNRTMFTGDNLDVMRGMNNDTVDLIYLDPPFNSNRNYSAPIGSEAAGAAFKDTWTLSDVDDAWHGLIAEAEPGIYRFIDAAGIVHGKPMKSYLIMMAVRLLEMRRILKPTGSIYLHCDDTAGRYLNILMDAVFGPGNFRNSIAWKRTSAHSGAKRFGRIHDTILYYANGPAFTWIPQYESHDTEYVRRNYRFDDRDGRGKWRSGDLTGPGLRSGESGMPWRGADPEKSGRHWSVPREGGMADWIVESGLIPGYRELTSAHERLDALDAAGMIHWPNRPDGTPNLKRYLSSTRGNPAIDMILNVNPLNRNSREYVNYPTQKPVALIERIIKASSNEGDLVFDPFAGCATACVAAERLNRRWLGIDLSPLAYRLVHKRFARELQIGSEESPTLTGWNLTHRTDIPRRTDLGVIPNYRTQKHTLFGRQEGNCAGCQVMFPFRNFTIDHVIPQSKGGTDHIDNLQLLCGACNSAKGPYSQEELIAKLRRQGILD